MKKINVDLSKTSVCPSNLSFDISDDNTVHNVEFTRGCPGNLIAISKLCEGKTTDELIDSLSNIECGLRGTSCSAELANAINKNT